jgi:NHL repeat
MRLTLNRSCVATGAAVLALLAGSVAQNAMKHQTVTARVGLTSHTPGKVHPFVNHKFFATGVPSTVAVSDDGNNTVDIFDESGTMQAQLTGFSEPQGLASDRQGNLYIADTEDSRIQVYAAGFSNPPTTWSDPGQFPVGVDVRNNGAFGAVTNIITSDGGPGSVTLFRNGSAVATITDPNLEEAFYGAFDATGSFYFDGFDSDGVMFVAVIAHANTGGRTVQYLTTSNSLEFPGGVQVNNDGTIDIGDQDQASIFTYNPPSGGSLGAPVSTTVLSGSSDAVTFAMKVHNHNLYTGDAGNASSQEYSFPGGVLENSITSGLEFPIGVAVTPTQMP